MVTTTIDVQPGELAARLRKAGLSEIDTATRRRAEYSSDASNYRVVPLVVAFPRSADEIVAALTVCRELGVPLVGRGAGTSIAGNALSTGLVLDTSRHLNRVLSVDPEQRTAVVEPGTVLDSITEAAAPFGLRFGPDPSTHSRATIGGAIGNNACGSRALRYGRSADNVVSLDVLAGTGVRFTAARYGKDGAGADSGASAAAGAGAALLADLRALADGNLATIRTEFGRFTRQVSGYSLEHLLPENGFDVAKFLSGTEGTLALTLGATVRLVDAPRATALAVLGYPDMPAAADAVPPLLPHLPVALEGLDSRLVNVVRTRRGPPPCPTCRAAAAGCSQRRPATRSRRRSPPRAGSLPTARASTAPCSPGRRQRRCGGSARTAPGSAGAPRPARPPGQAGRTRRCRRRRLDLTCASWPP